MTWRWYLSAVFAGASGVLICIASAHRGHYYLRPALAALTCLIGSFVCLTLERRRR